MSKRATKSFLTKISVILFLAALIITRLYNLEYTARYTEDESGFLVRAHQIFEEKKVTLVGQVNDTGTKVFSSSTVYFLLPFAIVGNFDPTSVFFGAAFWGIITVLVMFLLGKKINNHKKILIAILLLTWFPLLQMGRWAWNPNLIPLWISIGIIFYLRKNLLSFFLSGIFLGLSVHQHYYAIFAIAAFIGIASLKLLLKKEFKQLFSLNLGAFIMLVPFVIFDLRHPPGIFFMGASAQADRLEAVKVAKNILDFIWQTSMHHTQFTILVILFLIAIFALFVWDIYKKNLQLIFVIPIAFQFFMIAMLGAFFPHYLYPIIPFLFCWIIIPRKNWSKFIANSIITVLIIGGALSLYRLLFIAPVAPDLSTMKMVVKTMEQQISDKELKNVNIAALSSPDLNTYGKRYRDMLLVDNYRILTVDEYPITDNLFVVSKVDQNELRKDSAIEMYNFRNGVVKSAWQIGNWKLYLFNK